MLLATLLTLSLPSAGAETSSQPEATVVLLRPHRVSESEWLKSPHRKEQIIIDEQGEPIPLRIIEYE
jgi:alpha-D-ribose 1-methylphosphonate 5-phosphate C-P lyase